MAVLWQVEFFSVGTQRHECGAPEIGVLHAWRNGSVFGSAPQACQNRLSCRSQSAQSPQCGFREFRPAAGAIFTCRRIAFSHEGKESFGFAGAAIGQAANKPRTIEQTFGATEKTLHARIRAA